MNGVAQFHRTIGGSLFYESQIPFGSIGTYALGGRFRDLTNPNMWFYNGSTYSVGFESNATNNQAWITKQTGYTLVNYEVGVGTDGSEPLNHATPLIYINEATGYIYVIQNEYHVDRFKVYKSNSPEDISAFTLTGYFDTDGSYLSLIEWSGTTCVFTTRSGQATSGYDFNVITVDLDSPSGYDDDLCVEMSFATNSVRAYLISCNYYGTPTKRVYGHQSRTESTAVFYKISFLFSSDQENFFSLDGGHSEDIISAAISYANLETYYKIIGTDSDKTVNIAPPNLIQIDDDVYLSYASASDTMTINKYTYGSSGVQATYDLPYTFTIADNEDAYVYMYYDGTKIIGTAKISDSDTRLFTIQTDLTGFLEKTTLNIIDGAYLGLPWNMDDVTGNYLIVGRSVQDGTGGTVPYIITNNTWD